jgi:plasmid stabilization system protein ParE
VKRARFIAPVRREFLAHVAYYTEISRDLGARFAAAVEATVVRAITFPLAGSAAAANTRRIFVREFPYALVYRPDDNGIVIIALAHHSQRPEYWRPRVQDR